MHKIERLLQTLAPKGVEFRKIGEICLIKRGRVIAKKILQENGKYPVYSSQTLNNGILGFIDTYDFDGEFLTWTTDGAYAGSVFYRNGRFSITNVCGLLQVIQDNILHKYLYYILQITAPLHVSSGMGNPKLMSAAMQQITIPIPPLEIQQEIVKILDAFTELNTELNTELKARKKQYQYYQNMLLDFKDIHLNHKDAKMSAKTYPKRLKTLLQTLAPKGVEFRKLGDIGEFTRGNGLLKSDLQDKGRPVVHYGQIHTQYNLSIDKTISYVNDALFHKLKKAKPNDILIATTSENVKDVGKSIAWLGNEEIAFSGDMYSYSTNENPKFIIYYFQTWFFSKRKRKENNGN